jgi:nucleotide-binding universal stress UspA family protein
LSGSRLTWISPGADNPPFRGFRRRANLLQWGQFTTRFRYSQEDVMYRHALIPIDCTDDARQMTQALARFLGPIPACRATLVATITPSPYPEIQQKKIAHAEEALRAMGKLLYGYGVFATQRVLEATDGEPASAVAAEANTSDQLYDVILLGTYQTRPDEDEPCTGSLADKICRRANVPVLVLPTCPRRPA